MCPELVRRPRNNLCQPVLPTLRCTAPLSVWLSRYHSLRSSRAERTCHVTFARTHFYRNAPLGTRVACDGCLRPELVSEFGEGLARSRAFSKFRCRGRNRLRAKTDSGCRGLLKGNAQTRKYFRSTRRSSGKFAHFRRPTQLNAGV